MVVVAVDRRSIVGRGIQFGCLIVDFLAGGRQRNSKHYLRVVDERRVRV